MIIYATSLTAELNSYHEAHRDTSHCCTFTHSCSMPDCLIHNRLFCYLLFCKASTDNHTIVLQCSFNTATTSRWFYIHWCLLWVDSSAQRLGLTTGLGFRPFRVTVGPTKSHTEQFRTAWTPSGVVWMLSIDCLEPERLQESCTVAIALGNHYSASRPHNGCRYPADQCSSHVIRMKLLTTWRGVVFWREDGGADKRLSYSAQFTSYNKCSPIIWTRQT